MERRKAFNYLIQSTTSDLVLERAMVISDMLSDKKSFISHIIHDELVLDIAEEERHLIPEIRNVFAVNQIGTFNVNIQAGKNFFDLGELKL